MGGGGLSPLNSEGLMQGPEITAMAVADAIFEEIRASGTDTRAPERTLLTHPPRCHCILCYSSQREICYHILVLAQNDYSTTYSFANPYLG